MKPFQWTDGYEAGFRAGIAAAAEKLDSSTFIDEPRVRETVSACRVLVLALKPAEPAPAPQPSAAVCSTCGKPRMWSCPDAQCIGEYLPCSDCGGSGRAKG